MYVRMEIDGLLLIEGSREDMEDFNAKVEVKWRKISQSCFFGGFRFWDYWVGVGIGNFMENWN